MKISIPIPEDGDRIPLWAFLVAGAFIGAALLGFTVFLLAMVALLSS